MLNWDAEHRPVGTCSVAASQTNSRRVFESPARPVLRRRRPAAVAVEPTGAPVPPRRTHTRPRPPVDRDRRMAAMSIDRTRRSRVQHVVVILCDRDL